jgi:hypothetical protein
MIVAGQGPGLVVPGVTFIGGPLQWSGANYFGSPSKGINSNSQPLVIDFSATVTAFGVDLRAFAGFGDTATADVYASGDTTLIGSDGDIALNGEGIPVFFG